MRSLRAREIFNDAELRLIAIESIELQQHKTDLGHQLYGHLDPLALMICTRDRVYALDMQARPITVEQLLGDIPELEDMIAALKKP